MLLNRRGVQKRKAATALEFACEGATLVLAGRRMDALETAASECQKSGGRAVVASCDVANDGDLQALVSNTMTGPHAVRRMFPMA